MKERRQSSRHRTVRRGTILFDERRSGIDCTVHNLSDSGACLEVTTSIGLPEEFDFVIAGEVNSLTCKVVWRSGNRIGIAFIVSLQQPSDQLMQNCGTRPKGVSSENSTVDLVRTELLTLRSALDEVPIGVVLLDAELRAQFINRAYRKMWRLSDAQADSRPAFVALMYHGRDTRAYEIPEEELDAYIAQRVAHVKAGSRRPIDLRLASGEVLRFQCTALPGGGRMLSYTYVTDIVRHADELETLHAALDEIEAGVILLDENLHARFMNRAVRTLWHVSDEEADSHPPYLRLINEARISGVYAIPEEALDCFIADRIARLRRGDPTPSDLRYSDGRTIRSQCAILPNGGRLLTYTDVSDLVRQGELAASCYHGRSDRVVQSTTLSDACGGRMEPLSAIQ
jgi:PAS domain-containing protein